MWNFFKGFFSGPALDLVVNAALIRAQNELDAKDLSEEQKQLINDLLVELSKDILNQFSK